MTNHLPGNPYHERAESIRLMHAHLDEIKEQQPISRTTTELLLFEISDRLASVAYELRNAGKHAKGMNGIKIHMNGPKK